MKKRPPIQLNLSWFLYYGRKLNMQRQEILVTKVGEMTDMIACLLIDEGRLDYKPPKKVWDYQEAIALK